MKTGSKLSHWLEVINVRKDVHLAYGLQDLDFPQHGGDALSEGRLEQEAEDPFREVGDLGQLEEKSVGINTCFLYSSNP